MVGLQEGPASVTFHIKTITKGVSKPLGMTCGKAADPAQEHRPTILSRGHEETLTSQILRNRHQGKIT